MDKIVDQHCLRWAQLKRRAGVYGGSFPDSKSWVVVFQFYAALHLTQAYLLSKGIDRFSAKNHGQRKNAIRQATELNRRFREAYDDLRDLSENARYEPAFEPTEDNYSTATLWLNRIESILKPKLETNGATVPAAE